MRSLTLLALVFLLASCRSQKEAQSQKAVAVDSLARSAQHRTIIQTDSIASRLNFNFDTLTVTIERQVAEVPEIVKIRAVGGKIVRSKEQNKLAADHAERLDTLAYKLASSEATSEHTATTRVYDPPNATIIVLASLLLLCGAAYFFFRRKL